MTRRIGRALGLILMTVVLAITGWSAEQQQIDKTKETQRDAMYHGKPLSYWLSSIRARDGRIVAAFDAIRELGPEAWPAVEELTRIVAEPFPPVRIEVDWEDAIAPKLLNIQLRADAIDALTVVKF